MPYPIVFIPLSFFLNALMIRTGIFMILSRKNTFYSKAVHYRSISNQNRQEDNRLFDYIIKCLSSRTLYVKACAEVKKAGYTGKYHPLEYMLVLYGLPFFILLINVAFNPSRLPEAVIGSIALMAGVKLIIKGKIKKITEQFEKHAWRIYRYLHNQIASGIKITDAITTVYETVNDADIRAILVKFAATFQLTMNIEEALGEITARFGGNEASTLCMALREGVKTGDSEMMLKRQEDVMFNKYFNRLEAETEKSRTICILSATMFCAILVIMASVPIVMDLIEALDGIFIS